MDTTALLLMLGAAIILGLIAVVIDRLNFTQTKFEPREIEVDLDQQHTRDRTGSHVADPGQP
jgi:hypothetical protein